VSCLLGLNKPVLARMFSTCVVQCHVGMRDKNMEFMDAQSILSLCEVQCRCNVVAIA
jgi:hypothetical protein